MAIIEIKGLDKLQVKFKAIEPAIRAGIKASAVHIKGKVAEYPPSTSANDPGQRQWYERGWGSKWHIRGGGWHGRKSSETLGKKWTVVFGNKGMTARIGNNVSYGKYVQGDDDQAQALKQIGWKTTSDIADEERDTVETFIKSQIDKALSK